MEWHSASGMLWSKSDSVRNKEEDGETSSLIRGVKRMAKKEILDKLSIYVPQKKMEEKPVERLIRLSEKRDRSINYLVVDAILQYLDREEKK